MMSYVYDRHTIRNKSEEAFIAFKEALKFKYVALSQIFIIWLFVSLLVHNFFLVLQKKQLANVGELWPSCC